jgi:hypothetical protein
MGPEQEILAENTVWNTFERMMSYSFFQKAENQAFRGPIQRVTGPIKTASTFRFRTSTRFIDAYSAAAGTEGFAFAADSMKSEMRGTISDLNREPLKTP